MEPSPGEVTRWLRELQKGNPEAREKLITLVYAELRRLSGYYTRQERPWHTLQPTELLHEAYLKLLNQSAVSWEGRSHFFAMAAKLMRRILIDHARERNAEKRGGGKPPLSLDQALAFTPEKSAELIALDEALDRLETMDPRLGRIVELRYFGGLSVEETAAIMAVSSRTIKREWTTARAWLHHELTASDK